MTKLVLIGAGGHSKVIQDIVSVNDELELYAILDDAFKQTSEVDGTIYSNTSFIEKLKIKDYKFCLAIGNNSIRKKLAATLPVPMENYATLIHSSAVISNSAVIGHGTVVMPNAVINADTSIGNHSIVNTNAVVEHDNLLADYVHVSPGSTLSGGVNIGEGTHIGAGAVVIPLISVGSWSVVGAGAAVVNNIEDNVTVVGVPAKSIK